MKQEQEHRCAECGFLTIAGSVNEVGYDERKKWPVETPNIKATPVPCCYEEAYHLIDEVVVTFGGKGLAGKPPEDVVKKNRPCNCFIDWQPHKTPEEHREMLQDKFLRDEQASREAMNLAFQKEREERSYKFQEDQKEADRIHQDKQKTEDRAHQDKLDKRSKVWALIVGVAIAGFTALFTYLNQIATRSSAPSPVEFKPTINNIMPSSNDKEKK